MVGIFLRKYPLYSLSLANVIYDIKIEVEQYMLL